MEPSLRSAIGPPAAPVGVSLGSFERLYEDYVDFVWCTARRLGVPHASVEDAVQDVFVVLHRRAADYDGTTPVKRWILGITVRVVSAHRRRYHRKDAHCVSASPDSEGELGIACARPGPSAEMEQQEQVRLLEQLLLKLSPEKREVLVLAELEELTVAEIADLLGANVNTIYTRLRSARQEFEKLYERHRRSST